MPRPIRRSSSKICSGSPAQTKPHRQECLCYRDYRPVGQTIGFRRLSGWACGPRNLMKNWSGSAPAAEAFVRFGLPRIFNGLPWFFDPVGMGQRPAKFDKKLEGPRARWTREEPGARWTREGFFDPAFAPGRPPKNQKRWSAPRSGEAALCYPTATTAPPRCFSRAPETRGTLPVRLTPST